jgi:hypothetical protein
VGSAVGAASSGVRAGGCAVSGTGVGAGGAAPVGGFAGASSAAASAGGGLLGDEGGASSGVVGVESGCVGGDGAAGGGSAAGAGGGSGAGAGGGSGAGAGGGSAGAPTPGAAVSVPGSECSGLSCAAAVGTSTTKAAAVTSASHKIRLMRRVAAPHFRPSLKTSPIRSVRHRLAVAPAQSTFEYSARMLNVFRMSANCGNRGRGPKRVYTQVPRLFGRAGLRESPAAPRVHSRSSPRDIGTAEFRSAPRHAGPHAQPPARGCRSRS